MLSDQNRMNLKYLVPLEIIYRVFKPFLAVREASKETIRDNLSLQFLLVNFIEAGCGISVFQS